MGRELSQRVPSPYTGFMAGVRVRGRCSIGSGGGHRLLLFLLLGVIGFAGGCRRAAPSTPPASTPLPATVVLVTLTPWPTATATAVPTATPSPTATPQPPALAAELVPGRTPQGGRARLQVRLDRAAALSGHLDGRPLSFVYATPLDAYAIVPVPSWSQVGDRALQVEARAVDGAAARAALTLEVEAGSFVTQSIVLDSSREGLFTPGLRSAEERYLGEVLRPRTEGPMWSGAWLLPAQGIRTSPFGARRSYQGGPVTGYHGGLDIAAPEGSPILAPAAGRVVLAEPLYVRGNVVVLYHGADVYTLYFHLSALDVQVGQQVAAGERLGAMGTTGLSTGSHLHWEVRVGTIAVDPDPWMESDLLVPTADQVGSEQDG